MMKKRGKVFSRQRHEYKCGLLWKRPRLVARQRDPSAAARGVKMHSEKIKN